MNTIEKHLPNHICKTCNNLTYFDGYYCKLGRYKTKEGFLNMRKLSKCDGYIERVGSNWDTCKGQKCVFWCQECPGYNEDYKD